jgi:uncharacterized membrane protein
MPEFIDGLPLHPLLVHGVVVLVPLAALGAILVSVWAKARHRIGWIVFALAAVASIMVPLAVNTGEALERKLPADNPLIERHASLGDDLLIFVLPMALGLLALLVIERVVSQQGRAVRGTAPGGPTLTTGVPTWAKIGAIAAIVVTVAFSAGSLVQVYRIGEAGSRAVWDGIEDLPSR